jgi:hypothetical protein
MHETAASVRDQSRPSHGSGSCCNAALDWRLQAVCDEALEVVRERLAKVTLAELGRGK